MNIGARILKTGIAVTLAVFLSHFLKLTNPAFTSIAAFLAVQPSVYRSWKHLLEQLQANVIGAIFAISGLYFLGNDPLVIGLIVIILISINAHLGVSNVGLSVLVAIAILEVQQSDFLGYALERFYSIMLGVSSSILINIIFLPPKYEIRFMQHVRTTSEQLSVLLRSIVHGDLELSAYKNAKKEALINIKEAEALFELYQDEFVNKKRNFYSNGKRLIIFRQMLHLVEHEFGVISLFDRYSKQIQELSIEEKQQIQSYLLLLTSYDEKIFMKYENKVKLSYPDEMNTEISNLTEELMIILKNSLSEQTNNLKDYVWHSSFISSLIELSNELVRFDILVERYKKKTTK